MTSSHTVAEVNGSILSQEDGGGKAADQGDPLGTQIRKEIITSYGAAPGSGTRKWPHLAVLQEVWRPGLQHLSDLVAREALW